MIGVGGGEDADLGIRDHKLKEAAYLIGRKVGWLCRFNVFSITD